LNLPSLSLAGERIKWLNRKKLVDMLWTLLHSDFPPPRLVNMNVAAGRAPSPPPRPDLVVGRGADPGETNTVFRETFVLATNAGPVGIYLPRKTTSPRPSPQSGEGEATAKER
jgi:hypothetical protein